MKKYCEGGVTKRELQNILATLKYGDQDSFTRTEINELAQELGIGPIEKKHLSS